jgi:hypothetical protein
VRAEFRDIVHGWTLHSGIDDLTMRIEAAAEWTKTNGPLEPDEQRTIEVMIETQIVRGMDGPEPRPMPGDQFQITQELMKIHERYRKWITDFQHEFHNDEFATAARMVANNMDDLLTELREFEL